MEAQILSRGIDAAGISVLSALPEEPVTVGKKVLEKNRLNHSMTGSWIRVEPWNELLCGSTAVEQAKDQEFRGADGDFEEDDETLQDRRLVEIALGQHDQVAQDVRRTRSEIALFRDDRARDWLQRCVVLFCEKRRLQYVQGLSELAAPWALITDPPSLNGFGFRFLDRFAPYMFSTARDAMYEGVPKELGSPCPLVVLETHLAMFDQLLRYHDPDLASFMESCGLTPDAYATSWFVTIFARQTPIPVLLHLWERLVRSGDPLFHQFIALAWLLRNRRELLDTRRDDVPEVLSTMRLQSTEDVEGIWDGATALRSATPDLVCKTLRGICYESCMDEKRSSTLRALKATGIVVADADQVAELAMLVGSDDAEIEAPGRQANFVAKPEAVVSTEASIKDGRFVLVDCRSGDTTRGPGRSDGGTGSLQANRAPRKTPGGTSLCNGRFVWHMIDPIAFLGRESEATAELLRGVEMAGMPMEGPKRNGHINGHRAHSEVSARNGLGNGVSNGHGVKDVAVPAVFTAPTTTPGLPVTHVCFVGSGQGSGSWKTMQLAADPAVRLARGVARSGVARVCVLDGGFVSFEEALARRTNPTAVSVPWTSDPTPCATPVLELSSTAIADEAKPGYIEGQKLANSDEVTSAAIAAPADGSSEALSMSRVPPPTLAGNGVIPSSLPVLVSKQEMAVIGTSKTGVSTTASPAGETQPPSDSTPQTAPPAARNSNAKSSQGQNDPALPKLGALPPEAPHTERKLSNSAPRATSLSTPMARLSERKSYRTPSSRKISEPFKVYAAKSAEEMGRALRTVPISAGKPLEDAARICDSLAKTNVKVLGESRVSLTRSLARLEQLDARMSGTVGSFARHFKGRNRRADEGVLSGGS